MRTKASISRRHIGHKRRLCPHATQVVKCPHGMQARRFSSVKHKTQGFDGDESSIGRCKVVSIADDVRFFVCCSAVVFNSLRTDSDDVDMSTSVVLEESVRDDEQSACSRA